MDEILLVVLSQAIVEGSTIDIRSSHFKPVMAVLAVGETGWSDIMFQCLLQESQE